MSWPAEIDVFLAVGELALYVAYLDTWPARQRIWPWATALTGLVVSVVGNVGHIQAIPGEPVTLADRLTAATSPLAAFAGLSVGPLVVKMTRRHSARRPLVPLMLTPPPAATNTVGPYRCICGQWSRRSPAPRCGARLRERHCPRSTDQPANPGQGATWPGPPLPQRSSAPDRTDHRAGRSCRSVNSQ